MSLTPYSGPWNYPTAAHLMKRTTLGPQHIEIEEALSLGLEKTLDKLLSPSSPLEPPLNYMDPADPNCAIGEAWVDAPYTGEGLTLTARLRSLQSWQLQNIYERRFNIEERMMMFWHNHFPIDQLTVRDARFLYRHWTTLREHALGNFKSMIEAVTIDPAMLRYLDGRTNTLRNPNENYARELLELFTIGKGPLVGPGDYTHYTEDDVLEIARILTGWQDVGYNNRNVGTISSRFNARNHDTGDKILSDRLGNVTISNLGDQEYKALIDAIFLQDEVARFICRKLYRFFVATHIDDQIESDIIQPMAQQLRAEGYELKGVIRTLLSSEHFFHQLEVVGGIIANPLEFIFRVLAGIGSDVSSKNLVEQYTYWWRIEAQANNMQMSYWDSPDVAGWLAYYLEPQYSELWINSVTLNNRRTFVANSVRNTGFRGEDEFIFLGLLDYIDQFDNPEDIDQLITDIGSHFYIKALSTEQIEGIRSYTLQDRSASVWTNQYNNYQSNPTDPDQRRLTRNYLVRMMNMMLIIPEFQVI